jgi:hypothetical protein
MKLLKNIYMFFSRLVAAWKISSNPLVRRELKGTLARYERNKEYEALAEGFPSLVDSLLPKSRHEMRHDDPRQPLHVKIKSGEIMTQEEADQILQESTQEFCIPNSKDARKALTEHNEKYWKTLRDASRRIL